MLSLVINDFTNLEILLDPWQLMRLLRLHVRISGQQHDVATAKCHWQLFWGR